MIFLAITSVVLIALYFLIVKGKSAAETPGTLGLNGGNAVKVTRENAISPRNPWRATSIEPDDSCCDAAKLIAGKLFLDTERNIPSLPLQDCDASRCRCIYKRHDDRRFLDEDRRTPSGLQAELYSHSGNKNRRNSKRGRRKSDFA